jgi:small-conductance mechanosensitive channel
VATPAATVVQPWLEISKIDPYVQVEPALVLLALALGAALIWRLLLRNLSEERDQSLKNNFKNLGIHLFTGAVLYVAYRALGLNEEPSLPIERLTSYVGLAALLQGAVIFVKIARIYVFEYMYLSHRNVAFPLLVVNMSSLLLSIGMAYWVAAEVFGVKLAPLLATSAIFSIILGLALQDTLGNLFSGISLQFDKPYEIGHWVEMQSGLQKWIGQVLEIHWRATTLIGLSDEIITVPNRIVAQAQISNFTRKRHTILRSHVFKVPYGTHDQKIREALLAAATHVKQVRLDPRPIVLATESTDSGISYKLVYAIEDYGAQWTTADQVITAVLKEFDSIGVEIATPKLELIKPRSSGT